MGNTADVIEIVVNQLFNGQEGTNIYHFILADDGVSVQDLVQGFIDDRMASILGVANADLTVGLVTGRNLFDASDTGEVDVDLPGTSGAAGDDQSPFLAWAVKLLGDNAVVKNGAKRIMGINEDWTNNGLFANALFLPFLNTFKDALLLPVTESGGGVGVMLPIIVKRALEPLIGYRLPESAAEAIATGISYIIETTLDGITSQNSRKD